MLSAMLERVRGMEYVGMDSAHVIAFTLGNFVRTKVYSTLKCILMYIHAHWQKFL